MNRTEESAIKRAEESAIKRAEESAIKNAELEPVRSFLNRIDADLACGALQAAGIEAVVSADDAGGTRPHLWTGGVRVLVRKEDLEAASKFLSEAEQAHPNPEPDAGT